MQRNFVPYFTHYALKQHEDMRDSFVFSKMTGENFEIVYLTGTPATSKSNLVHFLETVLNL